MIVNREIQITVARKDIVDALDWLIERSDDFKDLYKKISLVSARKIWSNGDYRNLPSKQIIFSFQNTTDASLIALFKLTFGLSVNQN